MFKNLKQNMFKELKENMVTRSEVMGNPPQIYAVGQGNLGIFQTAFAQSSLIYTLLYSQFQRYLVLSVAVPFQNSILTGLVFTFVHYQSRTCLFLDRLKVTIPLLLSSKMLLLLSQRRQQFSKDALSSLWIYCSLRKLL